MSSVQDEMKVIYKRNGNRISAISVVEYAQENQTSAIYKAFDHHGLWNDKQAAELARLSFGRNLIRSYRVTLKERPVANPVRGYVSLTSDRHVAAPSYQLRSEVLSHELKHAQFEMDVVKELRSLVRRFADVLTDREQRDISLVAVSVEERAEVRRRRVDEGEPL